MFLLEMMYVQQLWLQRKETHRIVLIGFLALVMAFILATYL